MDLRCGHRQFRRQFREAAALIAYDQQLQQDDEILWLEDDLRVSLAFQDILYSRFANREYGAVSGAPSTP